MRNKRLDFLRGMAIVLVLLFHSHLSNAGWVGVDLFFVLSGFLISGLLFDEYKRRASISFKRFFIRRGFKIYPAYYVFLLVALLARIPVHRVPSPISYVGQTGTHILIVPNINQPALLPGPVNANRPFPGFAAING